jgi:hypothetical protein
VHGGNRFAEYPHQRFDDWLPLRVHDSLFVVGDWRHVTKSSHVSVRLMKRSGREGFRVEASTSDIDVALIE